MNFIKQLGAFLWDISQNRSLILELTKKDLQTRYLGSYLGILWAFIQPTITVLIFWFVFEVGFKSMPVDNYPFILWFLPGMLAWFFLSDSMSSAANSVLESSYLVKKVVFPVHVLPVIKVLSALFVHFFFLIFLVSMFLIYGYKPDLYALQVVYYLFASLIFVLGFSWLTSAIVVFLRDVSQFITMMLQFLFWMTPILWSLKTIPARYHSLLVLNPVYYLTEGYRDCFVYHKWFWENMSLTLYFWTFTGAMFLLGIFVFKRLRPHFADVL
ncbi:MAG: ABC transporter permease [Sporomusaceae bacterium]|nr:ABC transporter permease [Sporomusaceae bacterium]